MSRHFQLIKTQSKGSYYSYPTYDETLIKWDKYDAHKISKLIRGLNLSPGDYFEYNGSRFRVLKVEIIDCESQYKPGTIVSISNKYIEVRTLISNVIIIVPRINQNYSIVQFVIDIKIEVYNSLSIYLK